MLGTVKWFNSERGFGFITPEGDHPEVFVHHSAIVGQKGRRNLVEFDRVEFRVVSGDRGPKAEDVLVIEKAQSGNSGNRETTYSGRQSKHSGMDSH